MKHRKKFQDFDHTIVVTILTFMTDPHEGPCFVSVHSTFVSPKYPAKNFVAEINFGAFGAVFDWQAPHSAKNIQRFLGFANFYRKCIPGFAHKSKPLTQMSEKGVKFA